MTEMAVGYMRLKQVLMLVPMCRTTWYDGIKSGLFPAPVKMGRMSLWRKSDILELVRRIDLGFSDSQKNEAPCAPTHEASKKSQRA